VTAPAGARPRPLLARTGAFFAAFGFAARLLLPEVGHHVVESTGIAFLVLGSGLLLLEQALRGRAAASVLVLLLPLLLIPAARFVNESVTVKRAIDVWAACMAGFAMRDLARGPLRPHVRSTIVLAAVALAAFGLAQTLFLRREVVAEAHAAQHHLTLDERGRAFLGSWRAAATFISPNAFAGVLLLLGMPLGFAAASAVRTRSRGAAALVVLAAVAAGGFVCAGSAGGTVAGLLGALVVLALRARGRTRRILAAALVLLALAAIAAVIAVVVSDAPLTGKLRTLQERADYHRVGLRLLGEHWLAGAGLDRTRLLTAAATRPGEAFSRYLHDWWLQGLVEGGIAFVPIAIAWIVAIARGTRRAAGAAIADPAPADDGRTVTAGDWFAGLFTGASFALAAEPFVSLLPYRTGPPIAIGLLTLAAFAALGRLVHRLPIGSAAFDRGLAAGCVAFALHGLVDFDLYMPGVMVAFAFALAMLPRAGDRARGKPAVLITGAWGALCILAPLAILMLAETREHVH
jgi:hypothetical protein